MKPEWINGIETDKTLSPYTGWTRAHWVAVLETMLRGVLTHFKPDQDFLDLPLTTDGTTPQGVGTLKDYGLGEILGRPMMLAAIYMASTGKTTIDGFDGDIGERFRKAIAAMARTNPAALSGKTFHRECDVGTQMSLVLAWDFLYEPLDSETKALLREHFRVSRVFRSDTNWRLFDLTQAMLLRRMGGPYDLADSNDLLTSIMNMYRGDGWFVDGGWNQQFDYYNFWGFQLYLHLLTFQGEEIFAPYRSVIKEITELHEKTLQYWMDADGDLIGRGRSLCYRFAAVSGLQWAQRSGLSSLSPGLARRISSGCIKSFIEHGSLRDDGTMPVGFHGENATVGEDYNSPGGPYWAVTGLAALLMPEDHPFWTAAEEPSAADSATRRRSVVHGAQMTLQTGGARREARLYSAGEQFRHFRVWEAGMKYYQHTYSSKIGFVMAGLGGPVLPAGKTGISIDGKTWVYRTKPRMVRMNRNGCLSEWNPGLFCARFDGRVVTESFFLDEGELHVFTHFSSQPMYLRLGGWSIRLQNGDSREAPQIQHDAEGRFTASSAFNTSLLLPLPELSGINGSTECLVQEPERGFVHTHLFGGIGGWTQWTSDRPVEPGCPVAVFVDAFRNDSGITPGVPDKGALLNLARSAQLKNEL